MREVTACTRVHACADCALRGASVLTHARALARALAHGPAHAVAGTGATFEAVKLISAEGFEFVVDRRAAMVSNAIKNMLSSDGLFQENQLGEIRFPEISTPILEKVSAAKPARARACARVH